MNTKELRVGNLLKPNINHLAAYGDNLGFVTLIQEDRFTVSNHYPGKWFEPIPLTEEWVVKFGFDNNQSHFTKWINDVNTFIIHKDENGFFVCDVDCNIDLQYVHQLQNTYNIFSNFKDELTLSK